MQSRKVSESRAVVSQVMGINDTNSSGNVHGGTIMRLVDTVGGVVAMRHCRRKVVTARIDEMNFLHPVYVGDLVTLKSSMNDVGKTSMEVGVRVETENMRTGIVTHTASAYLVYVALDDEDHPAEVPGLIAETEDERRRMAAAKQRRAARRRSG